MRKQKKFRVNDKVYYFPDIMDDGGLKGTITFVHKNGMYTVDIGENNPVECYDYNLERR